MVKGILIGILVYSLLLTIFCLYKDFSGYFSLEFLDVVFAGPVSWGLVGLLYILSPILKKAVQKKKKKEYIAKSQKYIVRVVKRIVRNYRKKSEKYREREYFDLKSYSGHFDYSGICGWHDLLILNFRYEWLNRKFEKLMFNQKEDTFKVLKTYFSKMTEEEMMEVFNDYMIQEIKRLSLDIYQIE